MQTEQVARRGGTNGYLSTALGLRPAPPLPQGLSEFDELEHQLARPQKEPRVAAGLGLLPCDLQERGEPAAPS